MLAAAVERELLAGPAVGAAKENDWCGNITPLVIVSTYLSIFNIMKAFF